jgi:hypothetical protein
MEAEERHLALGLSEAELRSSLEEELELGLRTEGNVLSLTPHAVAHAVARVIEQDHLRIAEQLERAGVRLARNATSDARRSRAGGVAAAASDPAS